MLRNRFAMFGLASALAAVTAAGCASTPGAGIFITGEISPDDMCIYKIGNARVLEPIYDVCRPDQHYLFVPAITNQLFERGGLAPFMADPNGFQMTGAEIELVDQTGSTISFPGLPNPFTVMASAYVPAGSSTAPGEGIGAIDAIPLAYGSVMQSTVGDSGTIGAQVSVFGTTNGGVDIDGVDWHLPITLCCNCLAFCPTAMGESIASCPNGVYTPATGCTAP